MATKTKTIFDEIDANVEARAIAEADVAAGWIVPHEEVVKWLRSWGTANELPLVPFQTLGKADRLDVLGFGRSSGHPPLRRKF